MKIVVAILIFGIIVLIHEFGHFLLARINGIEVVDFSIGMGPRLCGFKAFGTKFSLRLFPIGGACMMRGENLEQTTPESNGTSKAEAKEKEPEAIKEEEHSFYSKNVWQRISVLFAGPGFNFVLAFLLSIIVIGTAGYDPARVIDVDANSPAAEAGLQPGDIITKIERSGISIGREIESYFDYHGITGDAISLTVKRDGKKLKTTLLPKQYEKYMLGFSYSGTENLPAQILSVGQGGPMEKAGLKIDDVITGINGTGIETSGDLMQYMNAHPMSDTEVSVTVKRNGEELTLKATPVLTMTDYLVGFSYNLGREKASFFQTLGYSAAEVKYWIVETARGLGKLVTGRLKSQDVGSAVAIVDAIGTTYEASIEYGVKDTILNMLYITILLSANIGVMNLLPIPALDGGKLLFCLIEIIRRKPIDREKEGMVHLIGMILLMLLMVFLIFNDIKNIFFH